MLILDRRHLLLALVPLAAWAAAYLVLDATRRDDVGFAIIPAEAFAGVAAAEARYRSFWISAFLLSAAASVAVGLAAALGLRHLRLARDRGLITALVLAVIVLAALVETQDGLRGATRWYDGLGRAATAPEAATERPGLFRVLFAAPPPAAGMRPALHLLDAGLDAVKLLGAIALTLVGAGFILTLAEPVTPLRPGEEAARLARAHARQQELLHGAAIVYVLALVAMLAWMHWPLPFLAGEADRAAYRDLVLANALVQGTTYSLGIAALYLPAAMLLRRRGADLVEAHPAAAENLGPKALDHQPLDQLRQLATLLLPTIIGLLPALEKLWN